MGVYFVIDKIESEKQKGDFFTKEIQEKYFWRFGKLIRMVQLPGIMWEWVFREMIFWFLSINIF